MGFSTNPLSPWVLLIQSEFWGKRGELERRTLLTNVSYQEERYDISFGVGLRNILFKYVPPETSQNQDFIEEQESIHSPFVHLNFDWLGWDPWFLRLEGEKYHYSKDMTAFHNKELSSLFSTVAQTLFSNFIDRGGSLEVGRFFGYTYMGLEWARNVSVLDQSLSTSLSIVTSIELSSKWKLQGTLGRSYFSSHPDSVDPVRFVTFQLRYYF